MRDITVIYEGLDRVDGSARFGFGEHGPGTVLSSAHTNLRFQERRRLLHLSQDPSKLGPRKRIPRKQRLTSRSALFPRSLARMRKHSRPP